MRSPAYHMSACRCGSQGLGSRVPEVSARMPIKPGFPVLFMGHLCYLVFYTFKVTGKDVPWTFSLMTVILLPGRTSFWRGHEMCC